jgi:hypothetical protein
MRPKRLRWLRTIAFSIGLVAVLALTGCGAKTTKAKGKVTSGGKPLVWGSVTLVDDTGLFHQGHIGLDGTYEIDKVPVGKVKIGVFSPNPEEKGRNRGGGAAATAGGGKGGAPDPNDPRAKFKSEPPPEPPKPPPGTWFPISDRYTDPNSSGLSGEVQPGKDLNIDLPK